MAVPRIVTGTEAAIQLGLRVRQEQREHDVRPGGYAPVERGGEEFPPDGMGTAHARSGRIDRVVQIRRPYP
jgi:hypothetical protein